MYNQMVKSFLLFFLIICGVCVTKEEAHKQASIHIPDNIQIQCDFGGRCLVLTKTDVHYLECGNWTCVSCLRIKLPE